MEKYLDITKPLYREDMVNGDKGSYLLGISAAGLSEQQPH